MFKALELGYKVIFCENCFAETEGTKTRNKDGIYKRETVASIYPTSAYTSPPRSMKLSYTFLPSICPLLLVSGKKGFLG